VPASRGVHPALLRGVEPFPTKELVPYRSDFLSGWVVERYQIDLLAAARHARERMDAGTRGLCARQVPGDTHRNLRVRADYTGQTFKHILAPVWLLTYNFGARSFQVVINGYTGVIAGEYPKSWVKILLTALAVAAVVMLFVLLSQN
ncbi:MAG: zinc ribbon domain-containing protein, partial [Limisphaerales bacterium]